MPNLPSLATLRASLPAAIPLANPLRNAFTRSAATRAAPDVEALMNADSRPAQRSLQRRLVDSYKSSQLTQDMMHTYSKIFEFAKKVADTKKDHDEQVPKIKAGDYCIRFGNSEMLSVSLNTAARAASITASTATSFGLVKALIPTTDVSFGNVQPSTGTAVGGIPGTGQTVPYVTGTNVITGGIMATNHFLINNMYEQLFLGALKAYYLDAHHDPVSAMEENFNNFVKSEFEPHKDDMPLHIRHPAEKIIDKVQSLFDTLRPNKDKPTDMKSFGLEDTVAFIATATYWLKEFLVHRQDGLLEMKGWRNPNERKETLLYLREEMKFYKDPMTRDKLLNFFLSHGMRSIERSEYVIPPDMLGRPLKKVSELTNEDDWHHWHEVPELPQKIMMVLGLPGVGKGKLKTLMEKLGIRYFSQTYQTMMKGGVSAGDPAKWRAINQRKYLTREGDLLGERIFRMLGTACRNPVRIVDEPDWSDKEGAKRDNDPFMENFETECLEAAYRVLDSSTMMTCNNVPVADKIRTVEETFKDIDPAFLSRMDYVLIGDADPKTMRQEAIRAYQAFAARVCLPFKDGSPAILAGRRQQEKLQEIFKGVLDRLVELHSDKKGDLRMYTVVEPVFMQIVGRLLKEGLDGETPVNVEEMKKWVDDYYAPMPNHNPYSESFKKEHGKDAPPQEAAAALGLQERAWNIINGFFRRA